MIWDLDKLDRGHTKAGPGVALQYAHQLIEDGTPASLAEAALLYASLLADPALLAISPYRAEIQSLYGSLLCLQAQNAPNTGTTAPLLERARLLLLAALGFRDRHTMPEAWATTSANLALVYITRYTRTGDPVDVMSAHMALDGCLEVYLSTDNAASANWVRSLRTYLVTTVERRRTPR
ncbi:MAG TPA: hypothetical protein VL133_12675 [Devosia sp.]|nr:hypothetical protein [Devosia sp.]